MDPEIDRIIEEADNPIEAFFAAMIYYMVKFIFKIVEVVLELGNNTQESH